jgi:hypothetical protein
MLSTPDLTPSRRCQIRALVFATLAFTVGAAHSQTFTLRPLHFKGVDGSPMAVERVSHGFLLAPDGLLTNAERGPMIVYADPEGKFWTARWDPRRGHEDQ